MKTDIIIKMAPISGKPLILELWAEILLANEIAGFFKIKCLKKEVNCEMNFGMQINIKVFCKLILSFWVCVARLAQSSQNKKRAYLCNISKRNRENKDFLPADKHESFRQVDNITLVAHIQACPNYPK